MEGIARFSLMVLFSARPSIPSCICFLYFMMTEIQKKGLALNNRKELLNYRSNSS